MAPKAKPRPAKDIPEEVETKLINIFHPGYTPPQLIFKLFVSPLNPEEDSPDNTNYCVPRSLVLDACCILANNNAGTLCVLSTNSAVKGDMLPSGDYTFRITGKEHKYRYASVPPALAVTDGRIIVILCAANSLTGSHLRCPQHGHSTAG
jgi:hypothetical protein